MCSIDSTNLRRVPHTATADGVLGEGGQNILILTPTGADIPWKRKTLTGVTFLKKSPRHREPASAGGSNPTPNVLQPRQRQAAASRGMLTVTRLSLLTEGRLGRDLGEVVRLTTGCRAPGSLRTPHSASPARLSTKYGISTAATDDRWKEPHIEHATAPHPFRLADTDTCATYDTPRHSKDEFRKLP